MQVALTSANIDLLELAQSASIEPVVLKQQDQDIAVIVSAKEYRRLTNPDWDDFDQMCAELSAEAKANGLTEELLADLLAEIDAEAPR